MQFLKPKFWDRSQISIWAVLFFPISICFKYLIFARRILTKKYTFSIPIICVGNIYLGGTGKTPLCIELFSILKNLNKNPAFIRKQYDAYQDEINLLQHIGPTYQGKKRLDAINKAINDKSNIAILDDGFQDFSIKKNISIICFNEKQWIGNGLTLPSGPLRENLSSLSKADIIIINGKKNEIIEKKLLEYNHLIKIFYSKYQPQNISELKNKKFICFAGIGNPNNFFYLLKNNNIDIIEEISFPDHYNYSNMELESLIKKSKKLGINLLTTEKDYLRINKNYRHSIQCLKIKIEIENKNQFIEEIKKII